MFQSGNKASIGLAGNRSMSRNVIDLTGDDHHREKAVIDLTNASPANSGRQSPEQVANGHDEENGQQASKAKSKRRRKKTKKSDTEASIPQNSLSSAAPSLIQRLQPVASEVNQPSGSSYKPPSKRKRRGSVDSLATVNTESKPPPPKRQKSKTDRSTPLNDANPTSHDSKSRRSSQNAPRVAAVDGQALHSKAPPKEAGAERSAPSHKSQSNQNKKKGRFSQSPRPSSNVQSSSKRDKPAARARSASVTSIPPSPAMSTSALFYVDTAPNPENKHVEDVPKVAYRLDSGNLLLPENVVIEAAEEVLQTPGNEVLPPPTPGLSDDGIDVIDDNARNTRRYWEPDAGRAEIEECRTCGQFHTSKLCIGNTVCFTCGSTAHQAKRCPFKTVCYRCGLAGHIRADCPVLVKDLHSTRDCTLCGAMSHGAHNCSRNWRIYKYRDAVSRDKDVETRVAMKSLLLSGDTSVDEEGYIGVEPWCYNCGGLGHLGDECPTEALEDRPRDPSAFGATNVFYGPFAPRYRRVKDDIHKQLVGHKLVVFGDQVLDEPSLAPQYSSFNPSLPSDMPLLPGKLARQRERERLGKAGRGNADDDTDDWFSNRKERPAPARSDRDYQRRRDDMERDRKRDHDRHRGGRNHDRERQQDYGRRGASDVIYSSRNGAYDDRRRPRSPSMSPPPIPPLPRRPPGYPSSSDLAAGYRTNNPLSGLYQDSGASGLSIRGAAGRPRIEPEPRHGNEGQRRDYDRGKRSNGYVDDRYDRGHHGSSSGGRRDWDRDRDRFEDTRRQRNGRY